MKKVSLVIMILLAVSLVPLNFAFSQGEKTAKGRWEVGSGVTFERASYEGGSITNLTIMPRVSQFAFPKVAFELTPILGLTTVSIEGGESQTVYTLGELLDLAYHFEGKSETKYVPFVFAGFGFAGYYGDVGLNDNMAFILPHLGGGIKYFITNNAVMRFELFYEHITDNGGLADNNLNDFGLTAGVSIFLK